MEKYIHKVQYYETDKMGITHHSNYIRWMEEARIDFLEKIGYGYDKLEAMGIISPVLAVECEYKKSTTFGDVIEIEAVIKEFNGVKFAIEYEMKLAGTDMVVCKATSRHCFLGADFGPVRLKREFPEFYETMSRNVK